MNIRIRFAHTCLRTRIMGEKAGQARNRARVVEQEQIQTVIGREGGYDGRERRREVDRR